MKLRLLLWAEEVPSNGRVSSDASLSPGEMEMRIMSAAENLSLTLDLTACSSEEEAEREMEEGLFDAVFLPPSGRDLILRLRREGRRVRSVFLNGDHMALSELLEAEPFAALSPGAERAEIQRLLRRLMERVEEEADTYLTFQIRSMTHRISHHEILYLESSGRTVTLHTIQQSYTFYAKISDLEKELASSRFYRIHQAYLVNGHAIEAFQYDRILLKGGTVLPISGRYRARIRNELWLLFHEEDNV